MRNVKPQLHRGGDLVDILTAWAGGANEPFLELAFVQSDVSGYRYHDGKCIESGKLSERT
jgi:hypothetical protein